MYTNFELIFTIISLINLSAAIVIYLNDYNQGVSINSGKNFKSFKICMTMSILFGIMSMCLLLKNINIPIEKIPITNPTGGTTGVTTST